MCCEKINKVQKMRHFLQVWVLISPCVEVHGYNHNQVAVLRMLLPKIHLLLQLFQTMFTSSRRYWNVGVSKQQTFENIFEQFRRASNYNGVSTSNLTTKGASPFPDVIFGCSKDLVYTVWSPQMSPFENFWQKSDNFFYHNHDSGNKDCDNLARIQNLLTRN